MKIGLVGPGYWGNLVLDELEQHPEVDEIVVVSKEDNLSEICGDDDISHVFVTSPVNTHFDVCKEIIRSGKAVMCEKNLTPKLYFSELLMLQASYVGVQMLVDFIYSFNPALEIVRDSIIANPLQPGDEIAIQFLQRGVIRNENVMSVLGCHALAVLGTVTDISDAKLVSKIAMAGQKDLAVRVVYTLANGVRAAIDVSLLHHEKIRTIKVSSGPEIPLDYPNGIRTMIDRFFNGEDNTCLALEVARCLERAR